MKQRNNLKISFQEICEQSQNEINDREILSLNLQKQINSDNNNQYRDMLKLVDKEIWNPSNNLISISQNTENINHNNFTNTNTNKINVKKIYLRFFNEKNNISNNNNKDKDKCYINNKSKKSSDKTNTATSPRDKRLNSCKKLKIFSLKSEHQNDDINYNYTIPRRLHSEINYRMDTNTNQLISNNIKIINNEDNNQNINIIDCSINNNNNSNYINSITNKNLLTTPNSLYYIKENDNLNLNKLEKKPKKSLITNIDLNGNNKIFDKKNNNTIPKNIKLELFHKSKVVIPTVFSNIIIQNRNDYIPNKAIKVNSTILRLHKLLNKHENKNIIVKSEKNLGQIFKSQTTSNFNNKYNLLYKSKNIKERNNVQNFFNGLKYKRGMDFQVYIDKCLDNNIVSELKNKKNIKKLNKIKLKNLSLKGDSFENTNMVFYKIKNCLFNSFNEKEDSRNKNNKINNNLYLYDQCCTYRPNSLFFNKGKSARSVTVQSLNLNKRPFTSKI